MSIAPPALRCLALVGLAFTGCAEQIRQVDIRTDDLVESRNAVLASRDTPPPALEVEAYPEGDPFPADTDAVNDPSTRDPRRNNWVSPAEARPRTRPRRSSPGSDDSARRLKTPNP